MHIKGRTVHVKAGSLQHGKKAEMGDFCGHLGVKEEATEEEEC